MSAYEYVICDVFTDTPLEGNQLAVFKDARDIPDRQLQALAREINFSETVYAYPPQGNAHARIRIFTPAHELPFAGHPVLGTAFVFATSHGDDEIRLETGRGLVPIRMQRSGGRPTFGWMRQPLPTTEPFQDPGAVLAALGVERSLLPVEVYDNGVRHLYVTLPDEDAVARLQPDTGALARIARDCGVNCIAGSGRRWKTRMFAPGVGVVEDPATGSAAGPLAVHLVRHELIAFGDEIQISQGAELRRPSTLHAKASGSNGRLESVEVGGSAVIVGRGEFTL
jgi:trans-2,3-dihydro-3-hydroxyanthranilate isomerase